MTLGRFARTLATLLLICSGSAVVAFAGAEGVQITEGTNVLKVVINGEPFTEYHFKDAARPYYYPLLGPGGLAMSRKWPMEDVPNEEHDHPHHRSLWFA